MEPLRSRVLADWPSGDQSERRPQQIAGTMLFADLSGFTALSERLASQGTEGSERLSDIVSVTLGDLLSTAHRCGGELVSFGGDALVLLFTGDHHVERACHAAQLMRARLRVHGKSSGAGERVTLRMSTGIHGGLFEVIRAGPNREVLALVGSDVTTLVRMQAVTPVGAIGISEGVAEALPAGCKGAVLPGGYRLSRLTRRPDPDAMNEQVLAGSGAGGLSVSAEHRVASVAFVRLDGIDQRIADSRLNAANAVRASIDRIAAECEKYRVTLMSTDIDADGLKVLLLSGAPVSYGEDETRLLMAVRGIVDDSLALPARAGVHRGRVFVGDIGPAFTAMGDVVNTAARLMAAAGPGEVVASHEAVDQVRVELEVAEIPPLTVKGKRQPIHAVSVTGLRDESSPGQRVTSTSSFVGREHNLAHLDSAWRTTVESRGASIQLVGDAGIGKSALVEEFRRQLQASDGGANVLRVTADLYTAASPFRGVRTLLEQAFGLRRTEGLDGQEGRARVVRELLPDQASSASLLEVVWGASLGSVDDSSALAEQRATQLNVLVLDLLTALLETPSLLLVDDAHWIDDASSACLAYLSEHIADRAMMLLSTRRDGMDGFVDDGERQVLLTPLSTSAMRQLAVSSAQGGRSLPPPVLDRVVERAGGNPLFVVHLAAAASDAQGADDVPMSLEAVLAARLDRLAPMDRELLRRASVLGSQFNDGDLALVCQESALADSLPPGAATWSRLSDFVRSDGGGAFAFEHALLRDAAYGSLPFRLRRQLHSAIADAWSGDLRRADPATLSYHYLEAQRWESAWQVSRSAGEQALNNFAPSDAATLLGRAVAAARHLGDGVSHDDRAGVSLRLARAWERCGDFEAADRIYRQINVRGLSPERHAEVLVQRAWLAERQGHLKAGVRRARRAQRLLTDLTTDEGYRQLAAALTVEGTCHEVAGRHERAATALRQAMDLASQIGDTRTAAHAGSILGWALALTGAEHPERPIEQALGAYRELGDLSGEATCLTNLGALAYQRGHWSQAVTLYRQGQELQERAGDVTSAALGAVNVGEVLSDQGRWPEAVKSIDVAIEIWSSTSHRHGVAYAQGLKGRALARMGKFSEAEANLLAALDLHGEVGASADRRQVLLWLAEARVLEERGVEALTLLDEGADDRSATALRVRGCAKGLAGDAVSSIELVQGALSQSREHGELFEELLCGEQLEAWGVPGTDSRRMSQIKAQLGVVRTALPTSATGTC
jgi:class 3 adenylate cyclase/tetratricopeptide (TPR) repeat protein